MKHTNIFSYICRHFNIIRVFLKPTTCFHYNSNPTAGKKKKRKDDEHLRDLQRENHETFAINFNTRSTTINERIYQADQIRWNTKLDVSVYLYNRKIAELKIHRIFASIFRFFLHTLFI